MLLLLAFEVLRDRYNVVWLFMARTFWLASMWAVAIVGAFWLWQWILFGTELIGVERAAAQIPTYDRGAMSWHLYLSTPPG